MGGRTEKKPAVAGSNKRKRVIVELAETKAAVAGSNERKPIIVETTEEKAVTTSLPEKEEPAVVAAPAKPVKFPTTFSRYGALIIR